MSALPAAGPVRKPENLDGIDKLIIFNEDVPFVHLLAKSMRVRGFLYFVCLLLEGGLLGAQNLPDGTLLANESEAAWKIQLVAGGADGPVQTGTILVCDLLEFEKVIKALKFTGDEFVIPPQRSFILIYTDDALPGKLSKYHERLFTLATRHGNKLLLQSFRKTSDLTDVRVTVLSRIPPPFLEDFSANQFLLNTAGPGSIVIRAGSMPSYVPKPGS